MRATLQYYDPILRMTVLELPYKPFLKLHIRSFLNRLGEGGWHMVIFCKPWFGFARPWLSEHNLLELLARRKAPLCLTVHNGVK